MTQAEFIKQYGSVVVEFSHYYKYVFHYTGTGPNGESIGVGVGGDADSIYRLEVVSGEKGTVEYLCPVQGYVNHLDGSTQYFDNY